MTRKSLKGQELLEGVHYRTPRSSKSTKSARFEQRAAVEQAMRAENLTFDAVHKEILSAQGKGRNSAANTASALNAFVHDLGMQMADLVGASLRSTYYPRLAEHLGRLVQEGRPRSYVANRKCLLKECRRVVLKLDAQSAIANGKATPLGSALSSLEQSVEDFPGECRRAGISHRRIEAYIRGGTPGRGAFRTLQNLENHFTMASGTLTDLLPQKVQKPQWTLHGRRKQEASIPKLTLSYRTRVSLARKNRYLLRPEEITEKFKETWHDYIMYKTDPWQVAQTTAGKPRQLSCWRCLPNLSRRSNIWSWICELDGQWCPTAKHYFYVVSSFLGWLRKSASWGGGDLPLELALSLGWFADASRVKAFMTWRRQQAGNVINGAVWKILVTAAALCHPERGFLLRHPDVWRDFGYESYEAWREHCVQSYQIYRQLMKIIKPDVKLSRDPFEPIKDIVAMEHPLDAVLDAIDRMDQDRPPPGGEAELLWARNRLLLSLMASNPLRARNLKELSWREDNSGSLRKDPDGNYRIFIPSPKLKNHTGAGAKDYDVRVQSTLTPFIDKYLRDYLPRLSKGVTDRIFVPTENPQFQWDFLNETFRKLTRRYFVNSPGFGPHAMRHIIATALVKLHGSFVPAAKVLHDLETTVEKHYGHLIGDDGARWVEGLWLKRKK